MRLNREGQLFGQQIGSSNVRLWPTRALAVTFELKFAKFASGSPEVSVSSPFVVEILQPKETRARYLRRKANY